MIKNTIIPRANVYIKSRLSLDKLANTLSEKFFLGLKFGGKEKFRCNEDPAVFIRPFFGMEILLWHDLDEPDIFHLDVDNYVGGDLNIWQFIDLKSIESISLSKFLMGMLVLEGFDCYCFNDRGDKELWTAPFTTSSQ